MTNAGEFVKVLRPQSCPRSFTDSVRPGADRPASIVTLGKTIVVFYLAALMAAMISARVLPEDAFDGPNARSGEVSGPPPIILDGEADHI